MAKPSMDDEIDLIELIQIFWQHRIKFIVMGLLGLILGLSLSFTHEPEYTTDFSFTLGHPLLKNKVLAESALLQKTLNDSNLNPGILPNYSYHEKTQTYTVRSNTTDIQATVEPLLIESLTQELKQIKLVAGKVQGSAGKQVIIINNKNNKEGLVNFTNADLANLSAQDVLSSLHVSFSPTKALYPHPFKHGLIGIFIGVVVGFVWMVLAILMSKMNTAGLKRKA
jgi:hypothetical protein